MFDQTHHATRNLERALTSDMTARFCPARRLWSAALMLGAPMLVPVAGAAARRDEAPVQLALEAPPDVDPRGWLISEKFDGVRAWWDGQVLRFRSGIVIEAPGWFSASLPKFPIASPGGV